MKTSYFNHAEEMNNDVVLGNSADGIAVVPRMFAYFVLCATVLFLPIYAGRSEETVVVGPDAWHPKGLCCFKIVSEKGTTISLIRVSGKKLESLFTTNSEVIHPPICLAESIIAVDTKGTIFKYDFSGKLVFAKKPDEVEGVCVASGKINANHIFVAENRWDARNKAWKRALHVLRVSGSESVLIETLRGIPAGRIVRVDDSVVVMVPQNGGVMRVHNLRVSEKVDGGSKESVQEEELQRAFLDRYGEKTGE